MKIRYWLAATAALLGTCALPASAQNFSHGLFKEIEVTRPRGEVKQFVLLLVGHGADGKPSDPTAAALAQSMNAAGALVARVRVEPFYERLEAEGGSCSFANGALENLAHHLQAQLRLPTYSPALLVGQGQGAPLAYAMLAQAAPGTFAGGLSVGFCPELSLKQPLCPGRALAATRKLDERGAPDGFTLLPTPTLNAPWTALQPEGDAICGPRAAQEFVAGATPGLMLTLPAQSLGGTGRAGAPPAAGWISSFETAYGRLSAHQTALAPPPPSLSDLPIVEVAAEPPTDPAHADRFVVLLSGDGGWAGIDKGVAAALAREGLPVAGFDSLRYFWSARTPQRVAADLDRLVRYYAARWKRRHVVLIGYSQGADVLPFAINRLPPATRARVQSTVLLGPGQKASFEFHVANWVGKSGDKPILPEAQRLSAVDTVCIYGTAEKDSLCPALSPQYARAVPLAGGHHFGGDYDKLAAVILEQSTRR
jgi:type IV secretory pathway VirJ component